MFKEWSSIAILKVWSRDPTCIQGVCEIKLFLNNVTCFLPLFSSWPCTEIFQRLHEVILQVTEYRSRWESSCFPFSETLNQDPPRSLIPSHAHHALQTLWAGGPLWCPSMLLLCYSPVWAALLLPPVDRKGILLSLQAWVSHSLKPLHYHPSYPPTNQWESLSVLEYSSCSVLPCIINMCSLGCFSKLSNQM